MNWLKNLFKKKPSPPKMKTRFDVELQFTGDNGRTWKVSHTLATDVKLYVEQLSGDGLRKGVVVHEIDCGDVIHLYVERSDQMLINAKYTIKKIPA